MNEDEIERWKAVDEAVLKQLHSRSVRALGGKTVAEYMFENANGLPVPYFLVRKFGVNFFSKKRFRDKSRLGITLDRILKTDDPIIVEDGINYMLSQAQLLATQNPNTLAAYASRFLFEALKKKPTDFNLKSDAVQVFKEEVLHTPRMNPEVWPLLEEFEKTGYDFKAMLMVNTTAQQYREDEAHNKYIVFPFYVLDYNNGSPRLISTLRSSSTAYDIDAKPDLVGVVRPDFEKQGRRLRVFDETGLRRVITVSVGASRIKRSGRRNGVPVSELVATRSAKVHQSKTNGEIYTVTLPRSFDPEQYMVFAINQEGNIGAWRP